jgi:hypothetical protein
MSKTFEYDQYNKSKFLGGEDSESETVEADKIIDTAKKIVIDKDIGTAVDTATTLADKVTDKVTEKLKKTDDLQPATPSTVTLYTIPKGTILYHGTQTKETFNPDKIDLSLTTRVSFFTPNKRLASDYILGCANYPKDKGFIHKFETNIDIDNVYIFSQYDRNVEWVLESIENKFCNNKEFGYLNGIGYFINEHENQKFQSDEETNNTKIFNSEFALCYPSKYLTYISSERCMSIRKLSEPYQFNT